jgi:hypothetical protein
MRERVEGTSGLPPERLGILGSEMTAGVAVCAAGGATLGALVVAGIFLAACPTLASQPPPMVSRRASFWLGAGFYDAQEKKRGLSLTS